MFSAQEAEYQLLGGLFFKPEIVFDLEIHPEDFYEPYHSDIFKTMQDLFAKRQTFHLADFSRYQDYARALTDGVIAPTNDNLRNYADAIREASRKRKVEDILNQARFMLPGSTSSEILSFLQTGMAENVDTALLRTAEQVFEEIVSDLALPPLRYSTGLKRLDTALGGGFYEGFTYGLAGAEKSGKTTFAHTISENLSQSGCKHLYVALEMGAKQIEQRNLARKLGINSLAFLQGRDLEIHKAAPNLNTIYLDAPGANLETILTQTAIAKLKHGITGFIVDYWQLVEGKEATEEKHLRNVAQGLANFARKQKLWCLLLAQRNKNGDLFGGGGLKKACDQLYYIEMVEGMTDPRWLTMEASRYTPKENVGSETDLPFIVNRKVGPFIVESR